MKNVHSAIISKKRFPEYRYAKNKFGDGVHVLWGIDADGKTHVATIRFDKDKFRGDDARYWLKEHQYDIQWFVDADEEEDGNLEGLSNKELTKKIMENFEQIKDFADKTFPIPVETRLGLTTINIYNKKDKNLIGQIDLEEGIILEGQIDIYSGKVETDDFLPYTKRLRDFIMQPGQLSIKAQEQAQLFGIGKITSQTREERWNKLNNRFNWIKNRLGSQTYQKIEKPLLKAKELLGIELNCEVTDKSLLISGDSTKIATQTERVPAYYAVAELFYLQPSHNYQDYSKNRCYPENCQTRDYTGDKTEKEKILRIIRDFDPIHLVTDNPSALEGPPVMTENGIVLGGNSRSISLQILTKDTVKYDTLYLPLLKKKIEGFGFNKNVLLKFQNPVLVRIIDIPLSKYSTYSNMLNKGTTQEMDEVTEAIALAKQFEEKQGAFENIAQIISENDSDSTFKELVNNPEIARQIIKELEKAGIITSANTNEWLSGPSNFSDKGKTLLEFMLLAAILPDKTLLEQIGNYSNKILRAIPQLIIIKSLPPEWNIIPEIQNAVKLEYQRRQTGATSTPEQLLNQTSMDSSKIDEKTANVWLILHYSKPTEFKPLMEKYIKTAKGSMGGSMFSEEKTKPKDVLKFYMEQVKSGKGLSDDIYAEQSEAGSQKPEVDNSTLADVVAVPDADLTVPELKVESNSQFTINNSQLNKQEIDSNSTSNIQNSKLPEDEPPPKLPTTIDILNAQTKGKLLILKRIKPLLGRLLEPCSILIYGEEGQGKTSLAMIAAEDLKMNGQVFYMLADKGTIDTRIKEQLNRLKIKSDIIFYPSQDWSNPGVEQYLKSEAKDKDGKPYNIKFVIIDKIGDVDNIEKNDWWNIRMKYPDISFIFIGQMDKAGKKYTGDSNLAYKVDTIIEVSNLVAKTVKKHRDGEVGKAMPILETKSTWDWKENMAKAG